MEEWKEGWNLLEVWLLLCQLTREISGKDNEDIQECGQDFICILIDICSLPTFKRNVLSVEEAPLGSGHQQVRAPTLPVARHFPLVAVGLPTNRNGWPWCLAGNCSLPWLWSCWCSKRSSSFCLLTLLPSEDFTQYFTRGTESSRKSNWLGSADSNCCPSPPGSQVDRTGRSREWQRR